MTHLESYTNTYDIVLQIRKLQSDHNKQVSEFMSQREKKIRDAISNNKNIHIKEWISSTDEFPFYKLEKIFEHFIEESQQNIELRIESYSNHKGIDYHNLFRKQVDIIAIADQDSLKYLKELLNSEAQTIDKLKEFVEDNHKMQALLDSFDSNIEDIKHDLPTYGLKGRCKIENDLRFPAIFNRLFRIFRPSTHSQSK
jgi:hypothetical protein